jgi:antitoxin YefM
MPKIDPQIRGNIRGNIQPVQGVQSVQKPHDLRASDARTRIYAGCFGLRALWTNSPGGWVYQAIQVVYAIRYTQSMTKIVPVREFRTNLSELLSDVADRRDHVLVTRNGKPAAALVPIDEYEALEETAEILSDSVTLAQIEAGIAELTRGESVTLDELRAELAERRASR